MTLLGAGQDALLEQPLQRGLDGRVRARPSQSRRDVVDRHLAIGPDDIHHLCFERAQENGPCKQGHFIPAETPTVNRTTAGLRRTDPDAQELLLDGAIRAVPQRAALAIAEIMTSGVAR